MGKVYPEDINNLNLVADTAPDHRQEPENFYPELTLQMMFDFLDVIRRRIGTVVTDRAIIVHPSNTSLFSVEDDVSEFFNGTDSTADDKTRGYFGQFINCPVVASSTVPEDVVACAQLYPDDVGYKIVAMNTSFIGQYVEQEEA